GEAYAVTSRARREMGQAVVRLDPFRVIDEESDALNPLDLLQGLEGPALESACHDVAGLLPGFDSLTDVWGNAAFGLLSGVVGYLAAIPEKGKFADLYSTFHTDDTVYSLAVVIDQVGKRIPKMSYCEISSWLQKADAERSRVLTSVTAQLKAMSSQEVQKALGTSTFSLADVIEGKPISIYVTVPPAKLPSHFSLLRVWIGTLLHCMLRRRVYPAQPTLFLLDECGKLGPFPLLEAAIVSGRDSGLRVWTFWHDLHQLRSLYPASWLVSNTGAFQTFGMRDFSASSELAALLGVEPEGLRLLAADEQIVWQGGASRRIKLLDYLTDPLFAGRFDQRSPRSRTPQV
ncbi:MAG TPA: type IV secretory system conjugative DNA transfer family protein, partial [Thermoanaerobaculia bacterium]|nr:type IV secretory system conjugative DNA transfer family protein [Thermoanaerobaculia bacterium]